MKAIQDFYPHRFAHCYGCGTANPDGHHLKSYVIDDKAVARFTPATHYSGGYPDKVYGGLIASLLDCHGAATAAAFAYRVRGRDMGDGQDPIRFVTASLKIDFKRPTPMGAELEIVGRIVGNHQALLGRKAHVALSLTADGQECAVGEMLAIELPVS